MSAPRKRLVESGLVAVLRDIDPAVMAETIAALQAGGVTAVEITVDVRNASDVISRMTSQFEGDDLLVGAGSVLDAVAARSAIEAGAEFVVGPTFEPDVVETAHRYDVPVAPGIMTPTEALDAAEAGADLLKVFPASTVGPDHLSAIQAPLGDLPLMPTGGVGPDNVEAFFEAGATVVGVGSALVDYEAIDRRDFEAVQSRAEQFVSTVEEARD